MSKGKKNQKSRSKSKSESESKTSDTKRPSDMTQEELFKKYGTKSATIRALSADNMKVGDIARRLGIIYQHAYNVLNRPMKRGPQKHPVNGVSSKPEELRTTLKILPPKKHTRKRRQSKQGKHKHPTKKAA